MTRRQLALSAFLVVDLALFALLVAFFPVFRAATDDQQTPSGAAWFEPPVSVAEFSLTDQYGNAFDHDDLRGRWHLIFFGFTSCPDVCPMTMQGLAGFYRDLNGSLQAETGVVLVTVDPLRDTPEVLERFVSRFDERFTALTGEYPQLERLAESLFVSFTPPLQHGQDHGAGVYLVQHSDYVAVVDPEGLYRGVIHAPHTPERLAELYESIRRR